MKNNAKTTNGVDILHRRYIGDNLQRKESLEAERVHAQVARTIYDLRKQAGLTQKEMAKLIGTTQSVISRLEDADYEGHSLSMLSRIAKALKQRLVLSVVPANQSSKEAMIKQEELLPLTKKENPIYNLTTSEKNLAVKDKKVSIKGVKPRKEKK